MERFTAASHLNEHYFIQHFSLYSWTAFCFAPSDMSM